MHHIYCTYKDKKTEYDKNWAYMYNKDITEYYNMFTQYYIRIVNLLTLHIKPCNVTGSLKL
jgi:hypothetical protein